MLLSLNACASRADFPARTGSVAAMPGTLLTADSGRPARPRAFGIDPYAALERSAADRARWAMEPATDTARLVWKPIPLKTAEPAREKTGPGITAYVEPVRAAEAPPHPAPEGEAVPDRVLSAGAEAAEPVCGGCAGFDPGLTPPP
ncbi:hypothetical protein [Methylobacterium trifolii]|uniref:Lipoprotein n=1 Tax=Methylobacterium trifolii TaxID=1003092 RepID=A0ABQ4U4T6_9HYPH|nr:hypothetical protein [Methylobacterium trifolii]GJE62276.1 hypothetical protein MPOCJGCO_4409 [Methylobacterium trifolii]